MSDPRVRTVLFICASNSARSIIAESILNREGGGRFRAYSAGSRPRGDLHPMARDLVVQAGLPTDALRSKSWEEFGRSGAPPLDFVFTVCDVAAGESCPAWPNRPVTAHWSIPDPAAVEGPEAVKRAAFADAWRMLERRIGAFLALPIESLDRLSLQQAVAEIGRTAREDERSDA